MGCNCGKPKCKGQCGCKSPAVLQINNPSNYITFHKVNVPAAMGDSTTNPPAVGKYRNVLLYYEADQTSWLYSTDGIPTNVTGHIGPVGPQGEAGPQGPAGTNGVDGFSPTATVVRTVNGATITITDAEGTTTAEVYDGNIAGIPIASADVLGAIKVGSNLSISAEGTLSADAQQVTLYSSTGQNTDGAMTQKATTDALALKADSSSLAPVATSGNYNDLSNLPTLPTVNNGALTIQQNGTTLDTFTANSSDDKTVNIQTITAETVAPAEEVGAITTNMIADGAVTNTKIDFSTFIKTGTVQVEYQANGTGGGFANVTFDTPFAHAPVVFAQDLLSNGQVSSLTVSNVTVTGFRVLARSTLNQSSETANVNWLAFSQQG